MKNFDEKIIVVDVGAASGQFTDHILSTLEKSVVYSIEPNLDMNGEKLLSKLQFYGNRMIYCPYALAETNGRSKLYGSNILGGQVGSLNEFNPNKEWGAELNKIIDQKYTTQFTFVDVKSVDEFISENRIEHIDFLKIDTQGSDIKILELFLKYTQIDCMVVEVNSTTLQNENIYKVNNSFEELVQLAIKHSLKILKILPNSDLTEYNVFLSKNLELGSQIIDMLEISKSDTFGRYWKILGLGKTNRDNKNISKQICIKLGKSFTHPIRSFKSVAYKLAR